MRNRVRTTATMAALVVGVALLASACSIDLGDLGGPTSGAYGINEDGVIVGSSEVPGSTPGALIERAFRRLPDGTMLELATPPGTASSWAAAINDAGEVAGIVTYAGVPVSEAAHLVRWDADGTFHDLGLLGNANATVRAIDDDGRIIGWYDPVAGDGSGFVFDPAVGHVTDLPDLPGGGDSYALGMNDEGDVVGWQRAGVDQLAVPVRWDLDAGTVTDVSSTWGRAVLIDINDGGTTVGQAVFDGSTPGVTSVRAAILRPGDTAPTSLDTDEWAFPISINDHEVVAGYNSGPGRAFRWDVTNGVVPLTTGVDSYGWDINDRGQIVGTDTQRAVLFVADPPA